MDCTKYQTDADFADAIRRGGRDCESATECLYRRYHAQALRMSGKMVSYTSGQQDEIADLLHDAFIVMIEKIRNGGYNDGALLHFWIGITKGLLRNKMKRDARMDLVEDNTQLDDEDTESPEEVLLTGEKKEAVDALLSRLGEKCKRVLLLWAGGYSMHEIADKLQLSSDAMARKTKYKCKNQLMKMLDGMTIDI
jgi:RNA polymerase sigma factor (sigma-70 family)